MAQFTFIAPSEAPEISGDIRDLLDEVAATLPHEQRAYSGESHPALDVLETDEAVEISMDIPGVPKDAVRVLFRAGLVIIAGEKAPPPVGEGQAYHLVEREFGRFARAVRLSGAFDLSRTRATLRDGELTIILPKQPERRGQAHLIPIA